MKKLTKEQFEELLASDEAWNKFMDSLPITIVIKFGNQERIVKSNDFRAAMNIHKGVTVVANLLGWTRPDGYKPIGHTDFTIDVSKKIIIDTYNEGSINVFKTKKSK